jgi:capsular exopolysaccharide synthesis family protein
MQTPSPQITNQQSVHSGHGGHEAFDWREYYYAIKSHAWIIVLCVILATLFGVFSAATQHGLFAARCILVIESDKAKVLSNKVEEVSDVQIKSADMVNTLLELLKSYPFALRVVNHLKLSQDQEFLAAAGIHGGETSSERAASALVKMVNASFRLNTRLIDIIVTSRNPGLSVKLANAYADEYLRYVRDQKADATRSASSFLMEESARLRKKMRASEEGMQSFRERERAASIESMLQDAQTQISELNTRQSSIQSKLTQINSDLNTAKDNQGNTRELLRLPSVAAEPKVAGLVTQIDSAKGQLVLVQQRYRNKHPLYISTVAQIDIASKELDKVLVDVVGLLESLKKSLEAQAAAATMEREAGEKRLLQVTSKSIEYNDLKRELESDSALYAAVLGRIKEVDVTKELSGSPVQIQELAMGASPVGKPPLTIILGALLKGVLIGVALVLGLHKLDTSLKTVDQLEHLTGVGVAAAVPQVGGASASRLGLLSKEQFQELKEAWKNTTDVLRDRSKDVPQRLSDAWTIFSPALAMLGHPHLATALPQGGELVVKEDRSGLIAEAFRSLRATVATNALVEQQRAFLITSALPSEGKSFCSSNFSVTLAQQGFRTLLVDADLRKPSISRMFFGMNRKPGLSEVLMGTVALPDAVNASGVEGLVVLTAGGLSSSPSELLAGQKFRDFLADALNRYDRVVIDSAPVLAVSDTLLIAPYADVLCMVVRSFMTPRKMVTRAIKSLADVRVKPTAMVFNCIPTGTGSYSYYYSGKYYGSYGGKGVYGS